nr:3436_t:CDS:10 [Entrophospora candida]
MDNEGRSCVYGLRHQVVYQFRFNATTIARCLTAVVSDTEHNKFLVGTQTLRHDNEIHLLEFNEDEFELTSSVYQHPEEIWDIATCPSDIVMKSVQSKATLWRFGDAKSEEVNLEDESHSSRTLIGSYLPLEPVMEVGIDDNIKKILWDPTKKYLNHFISIHDFAINIWTFDDQQLSSAKLSNKINFSSESGPLSSLTTGAWNPNQPEIAIAKECSIQGWDIRSQRHLFIIIISFDIDEAHSILVRSLDYNKNKSYQIASGGDDCMVRFWDLRNTSEYLKEMSNHTHCKPSDGLVRTYDQHEDSVYAVSWSSCDPWVFCSLSYDGRAVINRPAAINAAIRKKLQGYVGFANLPNQVHRKSVKKGFHFTVMIVGKSTLVNTLFGTTLYPHKTETEPSSESPKTVEIQSLSADIEENGVKLRLTVVDTPGFGDFVNNEESWKPILENIEARFDAYLEQENRVNRRKMLDNRVHACIYFIAPTGHSLKPLDVEFMRRLHTKVNLIPVIAKSDTLTEDEIKQFKQRILDDIAYHKIQIYQAPQYEYDDPETVAENREIIVIVGSDKEVELQDGRRVRGRKYPWGVIEVDNEEHNDFVKLRQMLIRTHMEELKEYTNDVLYENYRSEKLVSTGVQQDQSVFKEVNPLAKMEEERQLHEAKLAKMETEMKTVFQQKVQEKEAKLKQSEEELYSRHKDMKDALEKQRLELEEKKKRLESGRPITPEKAKKKGLFNTK